MQKPDEDFFSFRRTRKRQCNL